MNIVRYDITHLSKIFMSRVTCIQKGGGGGAKLDFNNAHKLWGLI